MHSQVLVIYPKEEITLDEVMYPYQEIDKTQEGKMMDERCQFFLTVPEKDIPSLLDQIQTELEKAVSDALKVLHYRTEHSFEETLQKYSKTHLEHIFDAYKLRYNTLKSCKEVKDLPYDDLRQIKFILEKGFIYTNKWADIYIKGKGYGTFHNPYELWDYYQDISGRFYLGTTFLISKEDIETNELPLQDLDVKKTTDNIHQLSRVWETIIFCETNLKSRLYTINDIRFDKDWNKDCLVDNLDEVLQELSEKYADMNYTVTALDFHW